ncbi:MAG: S8 family serine peptidase [Candidatus Woesearchaeota archaeon]|jgi:hypothetical protein|nr:S8 family serine peptidase [Candidatus Woesearchaeota archaeon]
MENLRKNTRTILILYLLIISLTGVVFASKNIDENMFKETIRIQEENSLDKRAYYIIKFEHELNYFQKDKLTNEFDFDLIFPINTNFWYISVPLTDSNCFSNSKRINNCYSEIENKIVFSSKADSSLKISEKIKNLKFSENSYTQAGKVVIFAYYKEEIILEDLTLMLEEYDVNVLYSLEEIGVVAIEIEESKISKIAELKEIKYLEAINVDFEDTLYDSKIAINANNYRNENLYEATGDGVKILQYEVGVPFEHQSFQDKLTIPQDYVDETDHATHVAGILVSNSEDSSDALKYQGIAKDSELISYMPTFNPFNFFFVTRDIKNHYTEAVEDYGAQIITNSWGAKPISMDCAGGSYTTDSKLLDSLTRELKVPIFWSAGNVYKEISCSYDALKSDYMNILPRASAKNVITVGAVNSEDNSIANFSSFGPTYDGRIKPEIVAPGCADNNIGIYSTSSEGTYTNIIDDEVACGTSFSTPMVSATGALMIETYKEVYNTQDGMLPSTYKAVLVNSANDLKNDGLGSFENDGPDFKTGFGLLNVQKAIETIENENIFESKIKSEEDIKYFQINVSENQEDLKITLAWDDLPGNWYDWTNLKNDLEIMVLSPTGKLYLPWTLTPTGQNYEDLPVRYKRDSLNVVEQVYVYPSEIEVGMWTILVRSEELEDSQTFSIAHNLVIEDSINLYDGLLAYYPFDGDAKDYSGNGNDGTEFGVTYVEGVEGMAAKFDGNDDRIETNLILDKNPKEFSFFVNLFIKDITDRDGIYGEFTNTPSNYNYVRNYFHIYENKTTAYGQSPPKELDARNQKEMVTLNKWINIGFIKKKNIIYWYVDGELFENATYTESYIGLEPDLGVIGSRYRPTHNQWIDSFYGSIDNFAIWNRSLSEEEIDIFNEFGID